jgi:hypothetical protein
MEGSYIQKELILYFFNYIIKKFLLLEQVFNLSTMVNLIEYPFILLLALVTYIHFEGSINNNDFKNQLY